MIRKKEKKKPTTLAQTGKGQDGIKTLMVLKGKDISQQIQVYRFFYCCVIPFSQSSPFYLFFAFLGDVFEN